MAKKRNRVTGNAYRINADGEVNLFDLNLDPITPEEETPDRVYPLNDIHKFCNQQFVGLRESVRLSFTVQSLLQKILFTTLTVMGIFSASLMLERVFIEFENWEVSNFALLAFGLLFSGLFFGLLLFAQIKHKPMLMYRLIYLCIIGAIAGVGLVLALARIMPIFSNLILDALFYSIVTQFFSIWITIELVKSLQCAGGS